MSVTDPPTSMAAGSGPAGETGVRIGLWRHVVGEDFPSFTAEGRAIFGIGPDAPPMRLEELQGLFEDWDHVLALQRARASGEPNPSVEVWIRRLDGARRRVRITSSAEYGQFGNIVATYGVVVDITDISKAWADAHENAQLLTTFIENAPAALAMFDKELRYMRVSRRWLAEYGLSEADVLGRSHYDVFPEISPAWRAVHARCLQGAVERSERDLFHRVDGRRQWLTWEVRPWFDRAGEIGGLLMMTRDITDLVTTMEAVERSERRLRLALEASGDVVWQRDKRTGEFAVAGGQSQLIDRNLPRILSERDIWELVHPEDRLPMRSAFVEAINHGRVLKYEHRVRSEDDQERWALSVIEPLRDDDGVHIGAIGFLKDITEQKAKHRALAEAHRLAEAASRAKTDFLATMSHEIRTPLNGVLGVAQALSRTFLNDRQKEMVDVLLSAARSLKTLVDDTLEVGRIESGVTVLAEEDFDVAAAVRDAAALYAPSAEEKGLAFEIVTLAGGDVRARGDQLRIRQIVTNLVGNAIKFTDRGGVGVEISVEPRAGGEIDVAVRVRDTGVGFDDATKDKIFDRFVQAESGARSAGAGLGLAIARSLARAMNGEVECESAPGQGSTFTFTCVLHVGAAEAAAEEAGAFEAQEHVMLEILVAEDHELNRKIIAMLLEPFSARITFVEDGLAACAAVERSAYDLVLMDMQMPLLDGLTATRLIRAREAISGRARVPIISLTAQASPEQVNAALKAGADAHIAKPIDKAALFAAMEKALTGGVGTEKSAATSA